MYLTCPLHFQQVKITCVACEQQKTCAEFEILHRNASGHRHICTDCRDLGKTKPEPRPAKKRDDGTPLFTERAIKTCQSKTRFETQLDAWASCANNVKRGRPLSTYKCPICDGFHKTSQRLKWAVRPDEVTRQVQDVVPKPPREQSG